MDDEAASPDPLPADASRDGFFGESVEPPSVAASFADVEDPSVDGPSPALDEPSPLDALDDRELDRAADRSFFAQPVPLKWIDGAENALRTGAAPQTGHVSGPAALSPWITSKRWPFGQR